MPERIDVSEFIITAAASAMNAQAWLSSPMLVPRSHCRYGDSADSPQHPSPPQRGARHQILHPLRSGGDIADGACGDAEHGHGDNEVDSRVVDAEQSHAGRTDPEGHELSAHDAAEKHEPLNASEQPHSLYYAGRHPLSLYRFHGRDMKNDSA